jgi:hypothetical protein
MLCNGWRGVDRCGEGRRYRGVGRCVNVRVPMVVIQKGIDWYAFLVPGATLVSIIKVDVTLVLV